MATVFILGAGASQPYGLPSGYKLVGEILIVLRSKRDDFIHWGFLEKEIDTFMNAIERSKPMAIDDLLIQRPEFLRIGKLAIAHALVKYEKEDAPVNRNTEDDWYSYFFEHLKNHRGPIQPGDYTFITFNYDTSLERYFVMATEGHYGDTAPDKVKAISQIPILHVHGYLGISKSNSSDSSFLPNHDKRHIVQISQNLRLTKEEADKNIISQAQVALQKANKIRFLGFGYHQNNLDKLEFNKCAANCHDIAGTVFGKTPHEIKQIGQSNPVLKNFGAEDTKIVDFFRRFRPLD